MSIGNKHFLSRASHNSHYHYIYFSKHTAQLFDDNGEVVMLGAAGTARVVLDVGLSVDFDGKGNEPSGDVLDIVNRLWALELALPVELFLLVAAVSLLVSVFFAFSSTFFFLSSVNNSSTYFIL